MVAQYAVLNALGIVIAAIGAGFAGGGLWVFVVVAAIFSARSRSKRPNAPASAAVLLIPILLEDLDDLPLYLLWSAFVVVAVIPFKVGQTAASGGLRTELLQGKSPVSLWTVWGGNTRTHLGSESKDPDIVPAAMGTYRPRRLPLCTAQRLTPPAHAEISGPLESPEQMFTHDNGTWAKLPSSVVERVGSKGSGADDDNPR